MRKTHYIERTLYTRDYSGKKSSMRRERNRRAGKFATRLAFPVVANLASLDEFRRDRGNHDLPALWALRGSRETADGGKLRPNFVKLHITVSWFFFSRSMPCLDTHLGKDATL
jgi:hypothetical protein